MSVSLKRYPHPELASQGEGIRMGDWRVELFSTWDLKNWMLIALAVIVVLILFVWLTRQ